MFYDRWNSCLLAILLFDEKTISKSEMDFVEEAKDI